MDEPWSSPWATADLALATDLPSSSDNVTPGKESYQYGVHTDQNTKYLTSMDSSDLADTSDLKTGGGSAGTTSVEEPEGLSAWEQYQIDGSKAFEDLGKFHQEAEWDRNYSGPAWPSSTTLNPLFAKLERAIPNPEICEPSTEGDWSDGTMSVSEAHSYPTPFLTNFHHGSSSQDSNQHIPFEPAWKSLLPSVADGALWIEKTNSDTLSRKTYEPSVSRNNILHDKSSATQRQSPLDTNSVRRKPETIVEPAISRSPSQPLIKASTKVKELAQMYDGLGGVEEPRSTCTFDDHPSNLSEETVMDSSAIDSSCLRLAIDETELDKIFGTLSTCHTELRNSQVYNSTGASDFGYNIDTGSDSILTDSFANVSERRCWYQISRKTDTLHLQSGDGAHEHITWEMCFVHSELLKIVRQWTQEDSLAGKPIFGGKGGGAGMFGWNSNAKPVGLDMVYSKRGGGHVHMPAPGQERHSSSVHAFRYGGFTEAQSSSTPSALSQVMSLTAVPEQTSDDPATGSLAPSFKSPRDTDGEMFSFGGKTPVTDDKRSVQYSGAHFETTQSPFSLRESQESVEEWGDMVTSSATDQNTFSITTSPSSPLKTACFSIDHGGHLVAPNHSAGSYESLFGAQEVVGLAQKEPDSRAPKELQTSLQGAKGVSLRDMAQLPPLDLKLLEHLDLYTQHIVSNLPNLSYMAI